MPETNQNPNEQIHKKHFRAFWPIMIIAVLSAVVGGLIVWVSYNSGLEDELNSLIPGSAKGMIHRSRQPSGSMPTKNGGVPQSTEGTPNRY